MTRAMILFGNRHWRTFMDLREAVKQQILNQVRLQVLKQIEQQISTRCRNQVSDQVWNLVSRPVWDQVWGQVAWVRYPVWAQAAEAIRGSKSSG
jgi:hypothetical protein